MKKLFSLLLVLAMMLSLVACGECDHDWEDATCEEPKTCSKCGETKGKPAGHDWEEEDGEMVCAECGEECKHDFEDGECVECGMAEDGEGSGDVVIQEPQGTEPEEDDEPETTPNTEAPSYSGSSTQGGEFTFTWEEFADMMNEQLAANGSTLQIGFIKIDSDGDAMYYAYSNGVETDYHVMYLCFDDYDDTLEEFMLLMSMDADEEELMWFIELSTAASMVCDDGMTQSEALSIYSMEPSYEDDTSIITEYWPRDVVHLLMYDGTNMGVYYNVLSENNY